MNACTRVIYLFILSLFTYLWLTLNWGLSRNSSCAYLKGGRARWAAVRALGVSPRGCEEYRQEARDPSAWPELPRGRLEQSTSILPRTLQSAPAERVVGFPSARAEGPGPPPVGPDSAGSGREVEAIPQGEVDPARLEPSIPAQPFPPSLRPGGNREGTFQRALACRVWKWNKSICK